MEIKWYGHSCFRLSERNLPVVVTDPYAASIGYPALGPLAANVVTISHDAPGHANLAAVSPEAHAITGPGEYEVGGVFVTGVATQNSKKGAERRNTLYVFDFDGLTVCHLGDLSRVLSQADVEALGSVDVLLVPVGDGGALGAAQAAEVVSLLGPSIVVPMHYQTPVVALKLDPVSKFLKEMGAGAVTPQPDLRVSKSNLPDETRVVVLEYQSV